MDLQQFTIMAKQFQSVLDASVCNDRGQKLGFSERQQFITLFDSDARWSPPWPRSKSQAWLISIASSMTCGNSRRVITPCIISFLKQPPQEGAQSRRSGNR
ncbi:hypothetical protein NKDENANG_03460 [Candidatus Entotheonellaceae bacterium PAL068K]